MKKRLLHAPRHQREKELIEVVSRKVAEVDEKYANNFTTRESAPQASF